MITYAYKIYYPASYKADSQKKWPLILFLHGAGERGSNLELVKRQGLPKLLQDKEDFPFVVAYPQCAASSYWKERDLNTWYEDVLQKAGNIDPARIYLTGISMGGYGTWHWAAESPEKFAAIIPVCGGGNTKDAERLVGLPIWAFHGAKDNIVPMSETVEMVKAVEDAGGKVKLTIYPDLYHDSWTATYDNPEIYSWMLNYKRSI
jgi:predicted peptidase